MEHPPFEDVFPIEKWSFSCHVCRAVQVNQPEGFQHQLRGAPVAAGRPHPRWSSQHPTRWSLVTVKLHKNIFTMPCHYLENGGNKMEQNCEQEHIATCF